MRKWLAIGVLWCNALYVCAQSAPPLETFTSADGTFQFSYPQNYDLLIGDRILKGTQGRHPGIPVCDFASALVCVIYPVETEEDTRFEAAAFSVATIAGVTAEDECLNDGERPGHSEDRPHLTPVSVNEGVFRHTTISKKVPGHVQAADSYRTFRKRTCYELHIAVSLADEPKASTHPANSLGDARADRARESLKLILSTIVFEQ